MYLIIGVYNTKTEPKSWVIFKIYKTASNHLVDDALQLIKCMYSGSCETSIIQIPRDQTGSTEF